MQCVGHLQYLNLSVNVFLSGYHMYILLYLFWKRIFGQMMCMLKLNKVDSYIKKKSDLSNLLLSLIIR